MKPEMPNKIWMFRDWTAGARFSVDETPDAQKYVRADIAENLNATIEALRQENAALREKLDLCGKWQDVDRSQNNTTEFILLLKKGTHKEVGFCHISNGEFYSTTFIDPCEPNVVLKCIPLPEGTEGL